METTLLAVVIPTDCVRQLDIICTRWGMERADAVEVLIRERLRWCELLETQFDRELRKELFAWEA
jgi:hypothetical protein